MDLSPDTEACTSVVTARATSDLSPDTDEEVDVDP